MLFNAGDREITDWAPIRAASSGFHFDGGHVERCPADDMLSVINYICAREWREASAMRDRSKIR